MARRQLIAASALAIATCLFHGQAHAQALPDGATVAQGSATVGAPSSGRLTVTQASDRAVINWNRFSVSDGNTVTFNQPNAGSVTLNRVNGGQHSQIDGTVQSNGAVYLVNPNGIAIGATGVIDTRGGFVGSTLNISDQDFMDGRLAFAGGGSTGILNGGTIQSDAYVALLGGFVSNSGSITANLGKVALGAGKSATLDLNGGRFLQVALPANATDAAGSPLIDHSGRITANGGSVTLQAAVASDAVRRAVNLSGVIEARTISGRHGSITLGTTGNGSITTTTAARLEVQGEDAGATGGAISIVAGGAVTIGGRLSAYGYDPAYQGTADSPTVAGGRIDITGDTVTVDRATILNNKGLVRIGGAYHYGAGDDGSADYQLYAGRYAGLFGGLGALATARTVSITNSTVNVHGGGALTLSSSVDTRFGRGADGNSYGPDESVVHGSNGGALSVSSLGTISEFFVPQWWASLGPLPDHVSIGAANISVRNQAGTTQGGLTILSRDDLAVIANTSTTLTIEAGDTLEIRDGLALGSQTNWDPMGGFGSGGALRTLNLRAGRGVTLQGAIDPFTASLGVRANDAAANGGGRAAGSSFIHADAAIFGASNRASSFFAPISGDLSFALLAGFDNAAGGELRLGRLDRNYMGDEFWRTGAANFAKLSISAAPGGSVIFYDDIIAHADAAHDDGSSQLFTLTGNLLFANDVTVSTRAGQFNWTDQATAVLRGYPAGRSDFTAQYLFRTWDGSAYQTIRAGAVSDDNALPGGGSVTRGAATIGATALGQMTVTQASARAVIDWTGFLVGAGNRITFAQPDANSVTLNRVTGANASRLDGTISANGAVYLINPNGIAIGAHGVVDTRGGFVASTLALSDGDFLAGRLDFAGTGSSGVSNAGAIRSDAYVALLGGFAANAGTITANLGKVGLGAASAATLDLSGTGFLQVALPADASNPAALALVSNSGTITADGGSVTLAASVASNAVRQAVNMSGTIQANTAGGKTGSITLSATGNGSITSSGTLRASGVGAGTISILASGAALVSGGSIEADHSVPGDPGAALSNGGRIDITGDTVSIANATISAIDRGLIRIGAAYQYGAADSGAGDFQYFGLSNQFDGGVRQPLAALATARTVSINAGTSFRIAPSSHGSSSGGTLLIGSSENNAMSGTVLPGAGTRTWIGSQGVISALNSSDLGSHVSLGARSLVVRNGATEAVGGVTYLNRDALERTANRASRLWLDGGDTLGFTDGFALSTEFGGTTANAGLTQQVNLRAGRGLTMAGVFETWNAALSVSANDAAANGGGRGFGSSFIDATAARFGLGHVDAAQAASGTVQSYRLAGGDISFALLAGADNAAGGELRLGTLDKNSGAQPAPNFGNLSITTAPGGTIVFYGDVTSWADATHQNDVGQGLTLSGPLAFASHATISARAGSFNWVDQATTTFAPYAAGRSPFFADYLFRTWNGTAYTNIASGRLTDSNLLPSGGSVAAGQATIVATASHLRTITQLTPRAVIDWATFNIGAADIVSFIQPSATSVILNRVSALAGYSTIDGQITANGQVYLINPNGIAIGSSGVIDTRGGFVASSLALGTTDFMNGVLAWSGSPTSRISNAGLITAEGASVALLGGEVSNTGSIATGATGRISLIASGNGSLTVGGTMTGQSLALGARDVVVGTNISLANPNLVLSAASAAALAGSFANLSIEAGNDLFVDQGLTVAGGANRSLMLRAGRSIRAAGTFQAGGAGLSFSANDAGAAGGVASNREAGGASLDLTGATLRSSGGTLGGVALRIAGADSVIQLGTIAGQGAFGNLTIAAAQGAAVRFGGDVAAPSLSLTGSLQFTADTVISSAALDWTDSATATVRGWGVDNVAATLVNNGVSLFRGRLRDAVAARLDLRALAATPSFTYGLAGSDLPAAVIRLLSGSLAPGDTLANLLAPGSISVTGTGPERLGVGSYVVTVAAENGSPQAGDRPGYFFDLSVPGSNGFSITPRAITYAVGNVGSTYGTIASVTPTLGGVLAGDDVGGALQVSSAKGVQALAARLAAGVYQLSVTGLTGASSANYVLAGSGNSNGVLTVAQRALAFAGPAIGSTYGDTASLAGGTLTGLLSGDQVEILRALSGPGGFFAPSERLGAGTYAIAATGLAGADAANYVLTSIKGQLTVAPRLLTIGLNGATYSYGSPTPLLSVSGVLPGDVVTPLATLDGAAASLFAIGSGFGLGERIGAGSHAFALTGLGGTSAANYGFAALSPVTVNITPRLLNWSVASLSTVYGTLASPSVSLLGVLSGDAVTSAVVASRGGAVETLTARSAAGGYVLSAGPLGGAQGGNYAFAADGNSTGLLTISPSPVSYSINATASVYGTLAAIDPNFNGLLPGDDVAGLFSVTAGGATADLSERTGVGIYSVAVRGLTGGAAGNYVVVADASHPGTLTISPRSLGFVGPMLASIYGNAAMLSGGVFTGLLAGDEVLAQMTLANGLGQPGARLAAGSYAILASGLTGAAAANYTLASSTAGLLSVARREIVATVSTANYAYGSPLSLVAFQNLLDGDAVAPLATVGGVGTTLQALAAGFGLDAKQGVGSYGFTFTGLTGADAANYSFVAPGGTSGTVTVDPRKLGWSVANASSTYGTLATPVASFTNLLAGDQATGLFDTALIARTAVGNYAIGLNGLTGANAGNYTLGAGTAGLLSILPKPISYRIDDLRTVYGTLALPAVVLSGMVAGDTLSGTVGASRNGAPVTLVERSGAGSYALTLAMLGGASASNYVVAGGVDGVLTIAPRPVTYTVTGATSVYGTLASPSATLANILAGDEVNAILGGGLTSRSAARDHWIEVGGLSGADASNYVIAGGTGAVVSIAPKPVTFTVANGSSIYGDGFTPGAALSGLLEGDSFSAAISAYLAGTRIALDNKTNAGSYLLTVTELTGGAAGNYTIAASGNSSGVLTISPRPIGTDIVLSRNYGASLDRSPYTGLTIMEELVTPTNLVAGDDIKARLQLVDPAGQPVDYSWRTYAGSYGLTIAGLTAGSGTLLSNYVIDPGRIGRFDIARVGISATVATIYRTYGDTSLITGATDRRLFADDDVSFIWELASGARSGAGLIPAGQHDLRAVGLTGEAAGNYYMIAPTFTPWLQVSPLALTGYSFSGAMSRVYGSNYMPAVDLYGVLAGDDVSTWRMSAYEYLNDRTRAGTYNLFVTANDLTGRDAGNYSGVNSATLGLIGSSQFTITKRPISFSSVGLVQTYGDYAAPSLVGALAGDDVFAFTRLTRNGIEVSGQPGAGSYMLTSTLSGLSSANYEGAGNTPTGTSLTITPRALAFTGLANLTYGDLFTASSLSSLFNGLVAQDVSRIAPVFVDARGKAVRGYDDATARFFNVGTYGLSIQSLGGVAGGNYTLAQNGASVQINPLMLDWRLGASHVYGSDATSASLYNITSPGGVLQYYVHRSAVGEVSGLPVRLGGSDVRLAALIPSLSGIAPPDRLGVGSYVLASPTLAGLDAGNFVLAANPLSISPLTITPRPIGVYVPSQSGEFGRNTSFYPTSTITGVLAGDLVSQVISIGGSVNGVGVTPGTHAVTVALAGRDGANYVAVPGLSATDRWQPFVIYPMQLSLLGVSPIYGSTFDPWTVLPANDAAILRNYGVGITSDLNTIGGSNTARATLTGASMSYFSLLDPRISYSLAPRPVRIGNAISTLYGNVGFSRSAFMEMGVLGGNSGLLAGTELETEIEGGAIRSWDVGSYGWDRFLVRVTNATQADRRLYSFYTDGGPRTLTIMPRPITVFLRGSSAIYGNQFELFGANNLSAYNSAGARPTIQITDYSGPLDADGFYDANGGRPITNFMANAGSYGIRVTGLDNPNYVLAPGSQINFSFTINPRPVTPSTVHLGAPGSMTYGDTALLAWFNYVSLQQGNGHASAGILGVDRDAVSPLWSSSDATFLNYVQNSATFGRSDIKPPDVGLYSYALTGLGGQRGANYVLTEPVARTMEITPRLFRYLIDVNRWYGNQITDCAGCGMRPNTSGFYQPGAIVPHTDIGIRATLVGANGVEVPYSAGLDAGTYAIRTTIFGADAKNYTVDPGSVSPTSMTIKKAIVGYRISPGTVHTGDGNPFSAINNPLYSSYIRGIGYTAQGAGTVTLNGVYGDDPVTLVVGMFAGSDASDRTSAFVPNPNIAPAGDYHLQVAAFTANLNNYELAPAGSAWAAGVPVTVYDFTSLFAFAGVQLPINPPPPLVTRSAGAQTLYERAIAGAAAKAAEAEAGKGGSPSALDALAAVPRSGEVGASTQGSVTTDLGSATLTAAGDASASADYSITLGKVQGNAEAGASGSVRVEYGPGYSEIGGGANASVSGEINFTSGSPVITGNVAANLETYALTGVSGGLGNGAEGTLDGTARAWTGGEAEGGLSVKDGKIKVGGEATAGAGASAGVAGSVGGDMGSVSAGATVYSPGVVGGGFSPSAGFSDGTLNIGGEFTLALGFGGISFNFNIEIDFEGIGGDIVGGLKTAWNAIDSHFQPHCDSYCQYNREREERYDMSVSRIMALDPFSSAEAILRSQCERCDTYPAESDVAKRVAEAKGFFATQTSLTNNVSYAGKQLAALAVDPSNVQSLWSLPSLIDAQNKANQALSAMNGLLANSGRRAEVGVGGKVIAVPANQAPAPAPPAASTSPAGQNSKSGILLNSMFGK